MKRILIVLFACLLAAGVLFGIAGITATNLFASGGLRGSGNIVTKRIEAPDFAAIDASRAVKVIVTDALTDEIVIEADDNVMEKVLVESRRGTLFVGIDKSVRRISDHSVTVRVPANGEIRALDASSAAKARLSGRSRWCEVDVSSAANFDAGRLVVAHGLIDASSGASADVHCTDTLRASASSGADISYSGECKVEAQHSSGGSVHSINR